MTQSLQNTLKLTNPSFIQEHLSFLLSGRHCGNHRKMNKVPMFVGLIQGVCNNISNTSVVLSDSFRDLKNNFRKYKLVNSGENTFYSLLPHFKIIF